MSEHPSTMPNFSKLEKFLEKYFPGEVSAHQMEQFRLAFEGYIEWNSKINVISRKDFENLAERHFLYSLAIAKSIKFKPRTTVLDVGTGGGFPGIPLAIFFPETQFHLVDSRKKKMIVVQEIIKATGLMNVQQSVQRAEEMDEQYDFVVSRAVASMDKFLPWVRKRMHCRSRNTLKNGILYLRGAGIDAELHAINQKRKYTSMPVSDWFEEEFFETKFLIHLSLC